MRAMLTAKRKVAAVVVAGMLAAGAGLVVPRAMEAGASETSRGSSKAANRDETVKIGNLEIPADCPLAKNEHPRLLVTREDLPEIRKRCKEVLSADLRLALASPNQPPIGCAALYLITGDKTWAERAKRGLKRADRFGALVYDWIWDTLTEQERRAYIEARFADGCVGDIWYVPEFNPWYVRRYGWAHRALVMLAIAGDPSLKDEERTKLNEYLWKADTVLRFLVAEHNRWLKGGAYWPESMSYWNQGSRKIISIVYGWDTATGSNLVEHWATARYEPLYRLYSAVPHRGTNIRDGDTALYPPGGEWFLAGPRYKDPVMQWIINHIILPNNFPKGAKKLTWPTTNMMWAKLLFYDPRFKEVDLAELPTARLFPGSGHVFMRSRWVNPKGPSSVRFIPGAGPDGTLRITGGWDKDATFASFKCGDDPLGIYHKHADSGHFVIHKRGELAMDSGWRGDCPPMVSHHHYMMRTIAHNTMVIFDPEEDFGPWVNDGGQLITGGKRRRQQLPGYGSVWVVEPVERGDIVAYEHWEGLYTYAAGNVTAAYSPHKLKEFTRQFLYLRSADGAKDCFVVFDRVESTRPEFPKRWLLHAQNEIHVNGKAILDKRNRFGGGIAEFDGDEVWFTHGDGKLFCRTLLPRDHIIRRIGGPDDKGPAVTTLTTAAPRGATKLTVADTKGFHPEDVIYLYQGKDPGFDQGQFYRIKAVEGSTLILWNVWGPKATIGPALRRNFPAGSVVKRPGYYVDGSYEYWVNGKNYHTIDASTVLGGHFRIEVEPQGKRTRDYFLHVLMPCARSVERMVPTELIERSGQAGARITVGTKVYEVTFNKTGEVGGHIRIIDGGRLLIDRDLTTKIEPDPPPPHLLSKERLGSTARVSTATGGARIEAAGDACKGRLPLLLGRGRRRAKA